MKRKPHWRQDTPRMQIGALLAAAQGNASNLQEGIGDPAKQIFNILDFLEQAQEIVKQMPEGKWSRPVFRAVIHTQHMGQLGQNRFQDGQFRDFEEESLAADFMHETLRGFYTHCHFANGTWSYSNSQGKVGEILKKEE